MTVRPAVVLTSLPMSKEGDGERAARSWDATAKLAASNQLRSILDDEEGLRAVSEAAAEAVLRLMHAKAVSVVLLDDRGYRDVVNVGSLGPGEHRFPEDQPYPVGLYPVATTRLLAGEAYVTIGSSLETLASLQRRDAGSGIGHVMSIPVLHAEELWGELFLLRSINTPEFTTDDLDVACHLAAQFGTRLPVLLRV